MKRYDLARKGVQFIEGQKNMYCNVKRVQRRSYLCVVMKVATFDRIKSLFVSYGICYITQTNSAWDLRAMKKPIWVTKVRGTGTTCIELLEEEVLLDDNDIYVVMWNARFLPRFVRNGRLFDMDVMLLDMLAGKEKPPLYIFRLLASMVF